MTTEQLIGFDKDYVDETVISGGATLVQQHNADEAAHPYLLNETNTLKNDLVNLGKQVSNIESKIPENTSTSNTLVNQTQLLNTELNIKEDIANNIEEHNISPTAHQDIRTAIETLQFVKWVDTLPAQGESKYIYAVPREETDTEGKQIAALYLWDGSAWRGAGAFSLNIDPDTLATKAELAEYVKLSTKGIANGVASLDANGKVPLSQLPDNIGGGGGGGAAPTLKWYKNNTGSSITIDDTSSSSRVKVYKNGVLLEPIEDYTISGTTLTLTTELISTDKITTEVF